MTFISYAQNFEDVLLWRALRSVEAGFYVDVGAQHPDLDSVTRAFYDRGWSGVNVEPVAEAAALFAQTRPRDVTLPVALAATAGEASLYVIEGSGLSTLEADAQARAEALGWGGTARRVPVETLAAVCARHAPGPIHFLKVDVEGAEAAVLAGADFARFRPWIVLVEAIAPLSGEASHAAWEPGLLAAGYRFAWFDGLNRFYVAEEHAALAAVLAMPPHVGDDFLRVAELAGARKVAAAEARAEALAARLGELERDRAALASSAERALLSLSAEAARRAGAEARAEAAARLAEHEARRAAEAERRTEGEAREGDRLRRQLDAAANEAAVSRAWLEAMRRSSSWRLTAPIRQVAQRRAGAAERAPPAPAAEPEAAAAAVVPVVVIPETEWMGPPLRTVHQFHSGSAVGDAITNAMLLTRRELRRLGYRSEIYVEHCDPALADELRPAEALPRHPEYVLLVRHSMGNAALDRVMALPAAKVVHYHNITPPELLPPALRDYSERGREQLRGMVGRVRAALADSEYNAAELRRLGFDPVAACTLLFDLEAVGTRSAREDGAPFTVLFVGRMVESKGQLELVKTFGLFLAAFGRPARLVLVGHHGGPEEPYLASVRAAIQGYGVDHSVTITGPVSDAALAEWFGRADLYVSLSLHEGFGVPLVEAMARGVPVLAWPAGAVAETVGEGAALLASVEPSAVAGEVLTLARDPRRRERLAAAGRRALERFALGRHLPTLVSALVRAGAAAPAAASARAGLARVLRYTVAGHVNGSYSLARINVGLAAALERERPGCVRVLPVEGEPIASLDGVAAPCRATTGRLAARAGFATGPEVVISQHYPVWVPALPGALRLALFFWEESLVPAATAAVLNEGFDAVLAPSRFVAKALRDSGVHRPIRILPYVPDLAPFAALAHQGGDGFTFLHVSSGFPRKGVDVLLAAYARAFRREDRVRLVLKTFPNPHNDVAAQVAALDAADPGHAAITLIEQDQSAEAMLRLLADADAMVLPTRGEGFNLLAAEAMAAGIPLIVTGQGGQMDFCGADEARLLRWRYAPSTSHLASAGSLWAEPDADDLVAALREAVAAPDAARVDRARARIAALQPSAMAAALEDAALDVILAPPAAKLRLAWISSWQVRCGIAEYSGHLLESFPLDGWGEVVVLADDRSTPAAGPLRVRPAWRFGDTESIAGLCLAVAQEDPHAVVIQHQPAMIAWPGLRSLLADPALRGRAVVLVLHNSANLLQLDDAERAAVLRGLAGCSRVLVHTVADVNRMAQLGLVENVALLPHGTLPGRPPRRVEPLRPEDPVTIGSYGFFLPRKGLPELVQAFAALRRRWPLAQLRLVNADYGAGASTDEILLCRRLAQEAGLGEAVTFHTEFLPQEESLALVSECDLVVLPYQSSLESSSAAMRSALSAGATVAVSPLPLFDEAGAAVARLPGLDVASIAAGMDTLLADPAAREALVQAAKPWLRERAWPGVAARLAGMLRGLAAELA